ncbi:MAG: tyrosine-type recombinase/integrase [Alphaproteobacteria bacterium]
MAERKITLERLPMAQWPEDIRLAWEKSVRLSQRSHKSTNAARLALELLFGLSAPQMPDETDLRDLSTCLLADISVATLVNRLRALYEGLLMLWPQEDWTWVNEHVKAQRADVWAAHPDWSVNQRRAPKVKGKAEANLQAPEEARLRLPVDEWPEAIKKLWLSLQPRERDKTDRYLPSASLSPLAEMSPAYIARLQRGMGRYLGFCLKQGLPPYPAPSGIGQWVASEQARNRADKSVSSYLFEVWRASSLMWPQEDLEWLQTLANRLDKGAKPVLPKLSGQVTTGRLRQLGWDLMEEAHGAAPTERNIGKYRDGLMIVLLTEKPMRAKNLAGLDIGHLRFDAMGGATLLIGVTKNRAPDLAYVSPELAGALQHWLDDLRPRLGPASDEAGLWIGRYGARLGQSGVAACVTRRTKAALGVAVSPHKFRNAVAMSIARHDPEKMAIASKLLGHKRRESLAAYDGVARSTGAATQLNDILADYTMPPPPIRKNLSGKP